MKCATRNRKSEFWPSARPSAFSLLFFRLLLLIVCVSHLDVASILLFLNELFVSASAASRFPPLRFEHPHEHRPAARLADRRADGGCLRTLRSARRARNRRTETTTQMIRLRSLDGGVFLPPKLLGLKALITVELTGDQPLNSIIRTAPHCFLPIFVTNSPLCRKKLTCFRLDCGRFRTGICERAGVRVECPISGRPARFLIPSRRLGRFGCSLVERAEMPPLVAEAAVWISADAFAPFDRSSPSIFHLAVVDFLFLADFSNIRLFSLSFH